MTQSANKRRRLHHGGVVHKNPGAVSRRTCSPGNFRRIKPFERTDAIFFAMANHAFPRVQLCRGCCRPQPASFPKVGVDPMLPAKLPDLIDGQFGTARDSQRFVNAKEFCKRGKFGYPGQSEPAISARSASPANILLENGHIARGRLLFDSNGSPESNETAAHNRDVRFDFSLQSWCVRRVAGNFLQPERAMRRHAVRQATFQFALDSPCRPSRWQSWWGV